MRYIVSTDAAADLPLSYIRQNDVKTISMRFTLDDAEYAFGNGEAGFQMPENISPRSVNRKFILQNNSICRN